MSISETNNTQVIPAELKTIFVFGPYGSGTTAVTGVLMRLGGKNYSGLSQTNDPRTPTSLEDLSFKSVLHELIDESILGIRSTVSEQIALDKLTDFRMKLEHDCAQNPSDTAPYIMKQPMAALLLQQIQKVFTPQIIYVTRSLEQIERSRIRRQWDVLKGAQGARLLFHFMMGAVVDHGVQPVWIHYSQLEKNPAEVVDTLASIMGIPVADSKKAEAQAWLTSHFLANASSST